MIEGRSRSARLVVPSALVPWVGVVASGYALGAASIAASARRPASM